MKELIDKMVKTLGGGELLGKRFIYKEAKMCSILCEPSSQKSTLSLFFQSSVHLSKRIAFTLAEVLITLGIVGVVAAMTMPTLIADYQKQVTVNKLKKTYSVLSQAIKLSENDNGSMKEWVYRYGYQDPNPSTFGTYIAPYLKAELIRKEDHLIHTIDNKSMGLAGNWYYTPDGTGYLEFVASYYYNIYIDINGEKAPNRLGRDVFVVSMYAYDTQNAKLSFNDGNCSKGTNASYAGIGCGFIIQKNGWQITPDYPW